MSTFRRPSAKVKSRRMLGVCDLEPTVVATSLRHARSRAPALLLLLDAEVGLGEGRDLGQVRDAQHLMVTGELGELPAHAVRRPTPDGCIYFVEDQHHPRIGLAQALLQGQEQARELSPRGNGAQGPEFPVRVGGEPEGGRLGPVGATD